MPGKPLGDIGDYSMLDAYHADRQELEHLEREGRMKHAEVWFRLYAINEFLRKIACLKAEIAALKHEWELKKLPLKEAWHKASYPVEDHEAKRKIKADGLEMAANYGGPIREKQIECERLENLVAAYRERLRVIKMTQQLHPDWIAAIDADATRYTIENASE